MHYLPIGGMVGLSYRDEFPMCEYTSVYGYTLDKAHGESWIKAIKYSWPYQITSLRCLSTFREYSAHAKVSSGFDL